MPHGARSLILVLTLTLNTNDVGASRRALAYIRPGRFDQHVCVPPPLDDEARTEVMRAQLPRTPFESEEEKARILAHIAAHTEGWSAADLAGLCQQAVMRALRADLLCAAVRAEDFEAGLKQAGTLKGSPQGTPSRDPSRDPLKGPPQGTPSRDPLKGPPQGIPSRAARRSCEGTF